MTVEKLPFVLPFERGLDYGGTDIVKSHLDSLVALSEDSNIMYSVLPF